MANRGAFKPGESGNPAGRPRNDISLNGIIRRRAYKDKYALAAMAWTKALAGDPFWAEFIRRAWPQERMIEVSGTLTHAIETVVIDTPRPRLLIEGKSESA